MGDPDLGPPQNIQIALRGHMDGMMMTCGRLGGWSWRRLGQVAPAGRRPSGRIVPVEGFLRCGEGGRGQIAWRHSLLRRPSPSVDSAESTNIGATRIESSLREGGGKAGYLYL